MKYCPKCDELIPLDAVYCQYCGVNTQNPEEDSKHQNQTASEPAKVSHRNKTQLPANIPFVQVMIGLFLLLLTFWSLSAALTILPIYIDSSFSEYTLPIIIAIQVVLRTGIALLAIDGRYFDSHGTIEGKVATILLTFIPIGALYSFLYAARSLSRRKYFPALSSSALGSAALSALLITSTYTSLANMTRDFDFYTLPVDEIPVIEKTPEADTNTITPTEFPSTQGATQETVLQSTDTTIADPSCISPSEISLADEGDTISVCGKVTNYGDLDCDDCKYERSFILLDKTFMIISVDWQFTYGWLDDCLIVTDTVENFHNNPVFIFTRAEGLTESFCYTNRIGELICEKGGYIKDFSGCED
ncbi:MAG: zinc ribbon domain-containing protein [Anaerolineales bacterium]|nr:zinc ribbon domain-containing protein [Anaerolineales bacterium]